MSAPLVPSPSLFTTGLVVVTIVFSCLSTVAVALRLYARKGASVYVAFSDDWLIIGTLIFCWANTVNTLVGAAQCGVDMAKVDFLTQMTVTTRTLFIEGFLLASALAMVKLSILHFYYRIFVTKCSNWYKWSILVTYGVITSWWISSIVCQFLIADPFRGAYTPTVTFKYRYNYNTWSIAFAAMSLFFDVVILFYPLPMIGRLKIDFKRKMSVMGIFWLGAFCCIAAGIRLYFLYKEIYKVTAGNQAHTNPFTNMTATFIWAHVEPNASIVAACLPTYGTLFRAGRSAHSMIRSIKSMFSTGSRKSSNLSMTRSSKKVSGNGGSSSSQNSLTRDERYYELREETGKMGSTARVGAQGERDVEAGRGGKFGGIEVTREWRSEML